MKENYTFYRRDMMEEEIDLVEMILYVLKKWKVIVIYAIIGALIGAPLGYLKASRPLVNVDNLSLGIKANLDAYVSQANVNEQINTDALGKYVLQLNDDTKYYTTTVSYTVRTDQHEDAELAAGYLDVTQEPEYLEKLAKITGYDGYIGNLSDILKYSSVVSEMQDSQMGTTYIGNTASKNSQASVNIPEDATPEETISALQDALKSASSSQDIEDIFSSVNKKAQAYAKLTYTISFLTKDETDEFIAWLYDEIQAAAEEYCQDYSGFKLRYIKKSTIDMQPSEIKNAKQMVYSEIAKRTAEVESAVASYLATIATTTTVSGVTTAAIITSDEKEMYENYWKSISDPEYEESFRIVEMCKWIIIVAFVFGFMSAFYYLVKYLVSSKRVYEAKLRNDYNLSIVGYVTDGKRKIKGFDKILDKAQKMMQPCNWRFIAESIKNNSNELNVLVHSSMERSIQTLMDELFGLGLRAFEGNILNDESVVLRAREAGGVYLVLESGVTTEAVLEAELHTIEMHGLSLLGVILI